MGLNWQAIKLWAVIALLAAVVASVHMAFVVSWASKRDGVIWSRVSDVDARMRSVERWKYKLETEEAAENDEVH